MMFYYAQPTPDRLVDEVRTAAAGGGFAELGARMCAAAFLGRVIGANPQRVGEWFAALADLDGDARETWHFAGWFSGQASEQLLAAGATPQMLGPAPDLLRAPLAPPLLDMLWGIYFATGDERAVRRLVGVLDLLDDRGAAAKFTSTARTEADRQRAINDAMFQAAAASLGGMMQAHPPLLATCERLFETAQLKPNERIALALQLQVVAPTRWEVTIDPATSTATVNKRR
jgi:hypothetical protein